MIILEHISGNTSKPFAVCMVQWWWRKFPAIENCGKVYCVIPSGDVELSKSLCQFLNDGVTQGAGPRAAAGKQ